MSTAECPAAAAANTKRMQLSADQRAVLEAVYAIEKLPDANLRERLSAYLSLSARQIQVWFQNRRQRAKAKAPLRSTLSTSSQIMDALFEFSDDVPMEARARMALNAICNGSAAVATEGSNSDPAGSSVSAAGTLAPSTDSGGMISGHLPVKADPDAAAFELSMPSGLRAAVAAGQLNLLPSCTAVANSQLRSPGDDVPREQPSAIPLVGAHMNPEERGAVVDRLASSLCLPPPMLLEAILGFACHVLGLDAIDYWQARPCPNGGIQAALVQSYAPEGAMALNQLTGLRSMLASGLSEVAVCTRDHAWFGAASEHQELLGRLGVPIHGVVGVPCEVQEPSSSGPRSLTGALVLYSRPTLFQTETLSSFLSHLGAAVGCACSLEARSPLLLNAPGPLEHRVSYTLHPAQAHVSTLSWLLLVAARALQADIAEHWVAEPSPTAAGSYQLIADRIVSSTALQGSNVILSTGPGSEGAHPFSSQMSRAALYAGKLVWCNATHQSGVLEGLSLPMKTAVGLPIRTDSCTSVFVLFSLRQLEQSSGICDLISKMQTLAEACDSASLAASGAGEQKLVHRTQPVSSQLCSGNASHSPAAGPAPAGLPSKPKPAEGEQSSGLLNSRAKASKTARLSRRPPSGAPPASAPVGCGDSRVDASDKRSATSEQSSRMAETKALHAKPSGNPLPRVDSMGGLPGVESLGGLSRMDSMGGLSRIESTGGLPRISSMGGIACALPRNDSARSLASQDQSAIWEQLSTEQVLTLIDNCLGEDPQGNANLVNGCDVLSGAPATAEGMAAVLDEFAKEEEQAGQSTCSQRAAFPFLGIPLQRTGLSGGLESLDL